jgi:hypothetical protein
MTKFAGLERLKEDGDSRAEPTKKRAMGKRQNPAYVQISAYVRRDLYEAIRRDLVGSGRDFSDLLEDWMEKAQPKP